MRGGMKTYRGCPAAARGYVEAGHPRADDYYLAEGTGIAERIISAPGVPATRMEPLTGDAYEAWVAGVDPDTGELKGRLRSDENAVRFVEVTVNGPKSWSLAAELHPDISAAYDAAQDRAATQIVEWLAAHSTTRVGPRGGQVQVPVESIEATVVRHYTSRAGDPHRHLHLQINARVFAVGAWRGLHTVGARDSLGAINGIGHAAVMTDPGFRKALAAHGFTLDCDGEVERLAPHVGAFSARAAQIGRHLDRYETEWRDAHPGQQPGPALRRSWDARAWADGRPDKAEQVPAEELKGRWLDELAALGYVDQDSAIALETVLPGALDRDAGVQEVLARLAGKRSGWNAADIRGEVEQLLARAGIVTDPAVRIELAEDITARTIDVCVPLLERTGVPEHIRALTSPAVLEVETDLRSRLRVRGATSTVADPWNYDPHISEDERADWAENPLTVTDTRLDERQVQAANLLAGLHRLVVIEGAAGAGKTTTLASARDLLRTNERQMMVVTPTLKAAKVASAELGSAASSAAWLAHQHGFRWDQNGHWTRLHYGDLDTTTGRQYTGPSPSAVLRRGDLLLVDEAGMLDQDTARALLTVADEHHVRVALMGDRHQLSAVGRGGVLDLAAAAVAPEAHVTLNAVHRFTRVTVESDGTRIVVPDVEYADLSLHMRTADNPADVFAKLVERGQVRVHGSDAKRVAALAESAATDVLTGVDAVLVADTRAQVTDLNAAVRERLVTAGLVQDDADAPVVVTAMGERIGVGDRVVTRRNDTNLQVANRDTWTVQAITGEAVILNATDGSGVRFLPRDYTSQHAELAYASTVHGVQGATADKAQLVLGEHTGASSAYVGMTRGRETNVVHLVVDNDIGPAGGAAALAEAERQWVATFARDRADLGPAHAAQQAAREAANYATTRPLPVVIAELHDAWTAEQDALDQLEHAEPRAAKLREIITARASEEHELAELRRSARDARGAAIAADTRLQQTTAQVNHDADRIQKAMLNDWDTQRPAAHTAAQTIAAGPGRLGHHRGRVADARQHLADWSQFWQPYLPAMPTQPDEVARFAGRWDNRPAHADAFDHYAHQRATELHPEHEAATATADVARNRARETESAYKDASRIHAVFQWRYGSLAHLPDPAAALADTEHDISHAHTRLDHAREQVEKLRSDPAVLSTGPDLLATEHDRWQRDRTDARAAAQARTDAATRAAERAAEPDYGHSPSASYTAYQQHEPPGPSLGM